MPQRIRAGCDTLKLRYSNGLLPLPQRIRAGCDFNTRHCNFRNAVLCHSAFVRVATAARAKIAQIFDLCHSAFVRVATKSAILLKVTSFLCHSAFVRVATKSSRNNFLSNLLCHSAFVRVATMTTAAKPPKISLCHSAFVRVATLQESHYQYCLIFATAHSCGLRQKASRSTSGTQSLPQRIRAGCDECTDQPIQVLIVFATAHSCGLRLLLRMMMSIVGILCHSAFVRVATAEKQCSALRICCEKVDSFSSVGESGLALTIFPFSFAAKATYVAINDSFGRAIDRFFWCEPHRN